jgi:hypothetical protein
MPTARPEMRMKPDAPSIQGMNDIERKSADS